MSKTDTDLAQAIEALASFFGLEEAQYHQTTNPAWVFEVAGDCWSLPFKGPYTWSAILFAAYAEAEMHKLGWYFMYDQAMFRGSLSDVVYGFDDSDNETDRHPCDPEQPVSRARAVLLAAADAAIRGRTNHHFREE